MDSAQKSYSRYTEAITTGIESIKQQENGTLMVGGCNISKSCKKVGFNTVPCTTQSQTFHPIGCKNLARMIWQLSPTN